MQGPQGDCLDIETLTQCELDGREAIWRRVKEIQESAGGEQVFVLDVVSQLGVRASRTLAGTEELRLQDWQEGKQYPDVIGVGVIIHLSRTGLPHSLRCSRSQTGGQPACRGPLRGGGQHHAQLYPPHCAVHATGHAAGAAAAPPPRATWRPASWRCRCCRTCCDNKRRIWDEERNRAQHS